MTGSHVSNHPGGQLGLLHEAVSGFQEKTSSTVHMLFKSLLVPQFLTCHWLSPESGGRAKFHGKEAQKDNLGEEENVQLFLQSIRS